MSNPLADPIHKTVIAPIVVGLSTLLWGEALLEVLTRGGMHSPDNLNELYLSVISGYATAGEAQKWLQKGISDPLQDPWVERMQRGGGLLAMWFLLLIGTYLIRLVDPAVPMPSALKPITTGLVLIFLAKRASRYVRHTRKGTLGDPSLVDGMNEAQGSTEERIRELLKNTPDGLSIQDLTLQLETVSPRQLARSLKNLMDAKRLLKEGRPHSKEVRYRLS